MTTNEQEEPATPLNVEAAIELGARGTAIKGQLQMAINFLSSMVAVVGNYAIVPPTIETLDTQIEVLGLVLDKVSNVQIHLMKYKPKNQPTK